MQDARQPLQLAPDAKIFEELYCNNVHASSIRSEDRTCLLCDTEYDDPSPDESGTSEHPVQVHFGECHHVFGHRCLRRLIGGQNAWSNKCPLCRTQWFGTIQDAVPIRTDRVIFYIRQREPVYSPWPERRRRVETAVRAQAARLLGTRGRNGRGDRAERSQVPGLETSEGLPRPDNRHIQ
jgi:hypothetical protein